MRLLFVFLAFAWSGLLAILGFAPNALFDPLHLPSDKTLHFIGFGMETVLIYFIWELFSLRKTILITGGPMLLLSIVSEVIQGASPYRSFEAEDIYYNVGGVLTGLVLAVLVDCIRLGKFKWLVRSTSTTEYIELQTDDV